MTITGTNLAGATAVDFGSMQVTSFISDTASQIIVSSPAGTGTVDVTVMTAAGTSAASSADQFSYFASGPAHEPFGRLRQRNLGGGATLTSTLTANALPLAGKMSLSP